MCVGLKGNLVIPNTVTTIESNAFNACSFENLTLSNSMTEISDLAFAGARFTGNLIIPSNIQSIGKSAFGGCGFSGMLTILDGVKIIKSQAFDGCNGFTGNLQIPKSVTEIEAKAFNSSTKITKIIVENKSATIADDAFPEGVPIEK